jgi:hypothetical protein
MVLNLQRDEKYVEYQATLKQLEEQQKTLEAAEQLLEELDSRVHESLGP